ncbi:MAG: site-specific integrase, partial [Oscillospiraceae bacterium]|nr:site-specific integrase [Oscillospiraceae bacterium]
MVAGHLQEKKGKYYIVLSYKDELGKKKTKWQSTGLDIKGNKKRAEDLLQKARKEFDPIAINESEITFTGFMKSWLKMMKPSLELTTYSGYSYSINSIICPYFEEKNLLLKELQPKHIQDFYTYCMNERNVKARSVIRYHANIRKALKYAVNTDLLSSNPADKVQRPKVQKFIGKFYDIDEVNELLNTVKGTPIELPVMLAAFYGLRRGEIVGLKWDAIDFKNNTISICHTVTSIVVDGKQTIIEKDRAKNKSSHRTLPLVGEFHEILSKLRERQEEYKILCGRSYNKEFLDYICVNEMGNRIMPNYVTDNFTNTLLKNNMRRIRFHDLRHTAAS